MSEEYHDPQIRTVKLDEIDPKEVIVVMEACAGAMGDSGAFELYSIHNGEVLYFYGNAHYGDLDLREAQKHLPEGTWYDANFCFHWDRETWEVFGGGMGNIFVIRKQYRPELIHRCTGNVKRDTTVHSSRSWRRCCSIWPRDGRPAFKNRTLCLERIRCIPGRRGAKSGRKG